MTEQNADSVVIKQLMEVYRSTANQLEGMQEGYEMKISYLEEDSSRSNDQVKTLEKELQAEKSHAATMEMELRAVRDSAQKVRRHRDELAADIAKAREVLANAESDSQAVEALKNILATKETEK